MKPVKIALAAASLLLVVILFMPSSYDITNAAPVSDTIVCFGDSLTYGTGAGDGMDYPAQLSRLIGRDIINAGVPGDTTASALQRIDGVLAQRPGYVLITLGGNDLKNGVDRETAFRNLETIVRRFQDQGAMVILGGIDIPFLGKGFGAAYRTLAENTGSVLVPNVLSGIMGHAELMSDTIHPNTQGYGVMTGYFHDALQPYLR